MNRSRRNFIKYGIYIGGTVAGTAAWMRGVRYPGLQFEPVDIQTVHRVNDAVWRADGAFPLEGGTSLSTWRAHSPEPKAVIIGSGELEFQINNIHRQATLQPVGDGIVIDENKSGLSRHVRGTLGSSPLALEWQFPDTKNYRFAAIGDTGGDEELRWVLARSEQLGAAFLLHLGDFNYQAGDYDRAQAAFDEAAIPTYITFGNHDYRAPGENNLIDVFTRRLGPLNHAFTLGGIQFINLDTAANTLPFSAGNRGRLLNQLSASTPGVRQRIAFHHRPLIDPRDEPEGGSAHDIGGLGEGRWLHQRLRKLGVDTVLNGHIHMNLEFDDEGLFTYISGQGLAHADIVNKSGRQVAQILLGDVTPNEPTNFQWAALEMPLIAHCNERLKKILEKSGRGDLTKALGQVCQRS